MLDSPEFEVWSFEGIICDMLPMGKPKNNRALRMYGTGIWTIIYLHLYLEVGLVHPFLMGVGIVFELLG